MPKSMSVAFLAPGLVAVGDTDSVKLGIDSAGGANITTNTELMDLVRDIDDSNAWAVGRFDALVKHANLPEGVTSQIPAVKWFSASGHVNGGLSDCCAQRHATIRRVRTCATSSGFPRARAAAGRQSSRDAGHGLVAAAERQRPAVALSFSLPSEPVDRGLLGAAAGAAKKSHEMHRERNHGADLPPSFPRPPPLPLLPSAFLPPSSLTFFSSDR